MNTLRQALLAPRSIAVVGASDKPGKVGYMVLRNLISGGFAGRLIPVNPFAAEVQGLPAAARIQDIKGGVDMAVVVVPAEKVLAVADDAITAGALALVVITAGFREAGPAGVAMETALASRCREAGVALLGPNCLGLVNTEARMNASFAPQMARPGGMSVISQSGALCTAILDMANETGLGLAKLISVGNKADLCESALLPLLAEDPQTKVIACYLESIERGEEFVRAAEATARVKPVVVLKAGITDAGGRAAASHTGALAGGAAAYAAAFKKAGLIQATTFEALFDIAMAFEMQPLPKGDRVAVITNAGGPGILAADAIESLGLKVQRLNADIAARLQEELPPMAHVGNPIDILGDAPPSRYHAAIGAALEDDAVDAVLVILTPQAMTDPSQTARTIIHASGTPKPMFAAFMGGRDVAVARKEFVLSAVPDYATPDRPALALRAMRDYARWRETPRVAPSRFAVDSARVEAIVADYRARGARQVGEADAKAVLEAYGFAVPRHGLAADADAAARLAESIGFPVALKIASPDIIHKSDAGGVLLNLASAEAVRDACGEMLARIRGAHPEARILGLHVEQMVARGHEVIMGFTRDPQFGPLLMFGLGGVFVEVMKDVSFALAPVTQDEALEMIEKTRAVAILKGARGQKPVDLAAVAEALQRLGQLAVEVPEIMEMDINPLMIYEAGQTPIATDARISLSVGDH